LVRQLAAIEMRGDERKSDGVEEIGSYDKYMNDDAPCWSAASQFLATQQESSAISEALPQTQAISRPWQPSKLPVTHDCWMASLAERCLIIVVSSPEELAAELLLRPTMTRRNKRESLYLQRTLAGRRVLEQ
jgi:hypothetical protein